MEGLKNKVAIVTGSGQWIGRAIALRLAKEGANVVINDIVIERADAVAEEARKMGREALGIKADVTQMTEVEDMVKQVLGKFGKIDILVNNAGGPSRRAKLFHQSSEDVWAEVINRNLMSSLICTRAVINHMMERKTGRIINICNVSSLQGSAGNMEYATAKAGLVGFTTSVAKEVAAYGIRINCVSPGPIGAADSPQYRIDANIAKAGLGREGKPEEIGAMVAYLASDDADFITGQNMFVCGLSNLGATAVFKL